MAPSLSETSPSVVVSLAHVELVLNGLFISRYHAMIAFPEYLMEQVLRMDGKVSYDGYNLTVARLVDTAGQEITNGIVTPATKFTFLSSPFFAFITLLSFFSSSVLSFLFLLKLFFGSFCFSSFERKKKGKLGVSFHRKITKTG